MKTPQKPISVLSNILGINCEVWLKFENKHHYGSHKGRSIPHLINEYSKLGKNSFSISSSGNAALAALRCILSNNKNKPEKKLSLQIFVGENIEKNKLNILLNESNGCNEISISKCERPKQKANDAATDGTVLLRGSTDPLALTGYESLSDELAKIENLTDVFIATSSGTCAEGIYLGFKKYGKIPAINIVQTDSCHPITNFIFEKNGQKTVPTSGEKSIANAIVDLVGRRSASVSDIVIESHGLGLICNNSEIDDAVKILTEVTNEEISGNGALAFAGLKKAVNNGFNPKGNIVCIVGGV